MKNGFLLFITLLLLNINTNDILAQRKEDVIYLSNGSIIHGKIMSDSAGQNIKILNHAGDTWAFELNEIDSVKQEKPFEYKAMLFNKPGFEFGINAEFLARSGHNAIGKAVIPGVILGVAYRVNPYVSLGPEIGMVFYDLMEVPLAVSLRVRSSKNSISPVLFLNAGYTLPAEKHPDDWEYKYQGTGGINSAAGIGLEKIINENTSFLFSLSYHYQELNYHLTPLFQWAQERDRTEAYSRFCIKMGFVFR